MREKKGPTEPTTLSDNDIETRSVTRRGLMRGTAAGAVGIAAAGLVPSSAEAGTDVDNGPRTDPGGAGRGYCRSFTSGLTDSDNGNWRDPGGSGRGAPGQWARGGWTDRDNGTWTDPGGQGRGYGRAFASGVTDVDQGNCSDPGGNGRG